MFSKSGYNDNLRELIKANKADKSVVTIIKENLSIQADAKSVVKKNEKEIKALNSENEKKQVIKTQTSLRNLKEFVAIRKELKGIKKQLKKMNNEVKSYNKKMEAAEAENVELENEIEGQYKIFQENEVYSKAFNRIDKNVVKIPEETYSKYMKHIELYNNSIYSVEKDSKLPRPNAEDFLGILNALKEYEEKQKRKAKRKATAEAKKAATKSTTKTTKKEAKTDVKAEAKKETAKKTTTKKETTAKKTAVKKEVTKTAEKKTTKKVATKKESK